MWPLPLVSFTPVPASHDGMGAGDHDEPYCFGRKPRPDAPFPFSQRQYARLLVLRGRIRARSIEAQRLDTAC